jgi:glutathione S-transferase
MISDGDLVVIESGAIIDYVIRKYGRGALAPESNTPAHEIYLQWLHYGEGSAMLPLMLQMYTARLGAAAAPLAPRIKSELDRHLGYVNSALEGRDWLVENTFSGADIQLSFVAEIAPLLYSEGDFPWLDQFRARIQAREAYRVALEKGGRYDFGPQG